MKNNKNTISTKTSRMARGAVAAGLLSLGIGLADGTPAKAEGIEQSETVDAKQEVVPTTVGLGPDETPVTQDTAPTTTVEIDPYEPPVTQEVVPTTVVLEPYEPPITQIVPANNGKELPRTGDGTVPLGAAGAALVAAGATALAAGKRLEAENRGPKQQ